MSTSVPSRSPTPARWRTLTCAAALAACTALAPPLVARAAPAVDPKIELDHPTVLARDPGAVYVLVELDVPRPETEAPRPPLNLALVIDRSGSMAERGKLEYARAAAAKLVDALGPNDRLAVVTYDDKIDLLWPSRPLEAKAPLLTLIEGLQPGGSTNLAGGLVRGVDEIARHATGGAVSRVVLLTDGLANVGVIEPTAIARLARAAKERGVRVTTMGLGEQYNEDLLQAVAEQGGGRYSFIEHPSQMSRIFADELSMLYASVAKNVTLKLDAGDRVKKVEVLGYPGKTSGKRTTVEAEDLYAGEHRAVLLRVELEPGSVGAFRLGTLLFEYVDQSDAKPRAVEREVLVTATADLAEVEKAQSTRVMAEATLIDADREQAEQLRVYEKGDEASARANLAALEQKLTRANQHLKSKPIAKKLEALRLEADRMTQANQSSMAKSVYLKKGKITSALATKGKRGLYVLEEGARGYQVERLQQALKDSGLYQGAIDGEYDADVKAAVEAFQKKEQLEADGVSGPATLDKLKLY